MQPRAALVDPRRQAAEPQLHAGAQKFVAQPVAHVFVETPEHIARRA